MDQIFCEKRAYQDLFAQLLHPLREDIFTTTTPGIHLGDSGAVYSTKRTEMEALIRPLWGLAPYWTARPDMRLEIRYIEKILQGTDPLDPAYWGDIENYDQYVVEMPAICLFLIMQQAFWERHTTAIQRQQVFTWLTQALTKRLPRNNWTFFKVWIRVTLLTYGFALDRTALEQEFALIDTMYEGDGWYHDGKSTQKDYYIAFSFHFYGLIYARLMAKEDPKRAAIFKERATLFAQDYRYYFDAQGHAIPFGRSLIYRFAQGAFFSALLYADLEAIPWGEMKWILSTHLMQWMSQPIFTKERRLSIGYHYENLVMAEGYNAPGSPYWSFKFFLLLALPEDHPFWQATPIQPLKTTRRLTKGNMLIMTTHDQTHVLGYPAGQSLVGQAHAADKYSKFVYSTQFGFSVAKASETYAEGAFDNTLAIAYGDTYYRSKHQVAAYHLADDHVDYRWQPYPDVTVDSTIYPFGQWHIRIHEVTTKQTITVKEGGFSVPLAPAKVLENSYGIRILSSCLCSSLFGIEGYDQIDTIRPEPNTSLYFNRTIFPYLTATLAPGRHRLIALVGGHYQKEGWTCSRFN